MATTPNIQQDVLELLGAQASISGADFVIAGGGRNAYPGKMKDPGIPAQCSFVELVAVVTDHHNDGNFRSWMVDVLVRGPRNGEAATNARAGRIHDAVAEHAHADGQTHGSFGPWAGPTSGVRYYDLRVNGIDYLGYDPSTDQVYAVVHLLADYDG